MVINLPVEVEVHIMNVMKLCQASSIIYELSNVKINHQLEPFLQCII